MKLVTGLEPRVRHLEIPHSDRAHVSYLHPDSDMAVRLPVPSKIADEVWELVFVDRESDRAQHLMILSKEPTVKNAGLTIEAGKSEKWQGYLQAKLESHGVPEDALRTVRPHSYTDTTVYDFDWFEVTL